MAKVVSKNQRMAWMASQLGLLKSNSRVVQEAMSTFGISLQTAKKELAEVYEHWSSFSKENAEADRHKVLEALWESVDQARQQFNYNAVIAGLREIARIQGNYADQKIKLEGSVNTTGSPASAVVRSRIQALANDPKIREKALKLGLDLDKIDVVDSESNE